MRTYRNETRIGATLLLGSLAVAVAQAESQLTAPGAQELDLFGSIIASGQNRIVASVPARYPALKGSVAIFDRVGADWALAATLSSTIYGDSYGSAVAFDGDLLAIGAPFFRPTFTTGTIAVGRLTVYKRDATGAWPQIYSVNGAVKNTCLGRAVGVSGNWIVAGAPSAPLHGSVKFYKYDSGSLTPGTALNASTSPAMGEFGRSVGIAGDWAAVAASLQDPGYPSQAGCVQLLARNPDDTWIAGALLTAPTPAPADGFGIALAMRGPLLVIGAPADNQEDPNADGFASVYRLTSGIWTQEATLVAPAAEYCRHFGTSVAVDGNTLLIGGATDNPDAPYAGVVHRFAYRGGAWVHVATVSGDSEETFGAAVGIAGSQMVIGVPGAAPSIGGQAPLNGAGVITILDTLVGDLNGDGHVNGADLALLLAEWGDGPGAIADLNGDGVVNGLDLGILLGNWQ